MEALMNVGACSNKKEGISLKDKRNQEYLDRINRAVENFQNGNKVTFDLDEFLKRE